MEHRDTIQENKVELENPGEHSDMVQEISSRGWGIMATPTECVNMEIVKEFYANTKLINEAPLVRVSWIRGREVPYDKNVIYAYIKYNYLAHHRKFEPFSIQLTKGN